LASFTFGDESLTVRQANTQNSTQRCRDWQSSVLFGSLGEFLFQAHTHLESVDESLAVMFPTEVIYGDKVQ